MPRGLGTGGCGEPSYHPEYQNGRAGSATENSKQIKRSLTESDELDVELDLGVETAAFDGPAFAPPAPEGPKRLVAVEFAFGFCFRSSCRGGRSSPLLFDVSRGSSQLAGLRAARVGCGGLGIAGGGASEKLMAGAGPSSVSEGKKDLFRQKPFQFPRSRGLPTI